MEGVCDKLNCKDALPHLQKGFEAFCESTGVDHKYINLSDRPNFDVTLSHGGIDPHPLEITVQAYDEFDAIDTVITKLVEHGIEGYAETDTPEHPEPAFHARWFRSCRTRKMQKDLSPSTKKPIFWNSQHR